jgi:hypothetical protein
MLINIQNSHTAKYIIYASRVWYTSTVNVVRSLVMDPLLVWTYNTLCNLIRFVCIFIKHILFSHTEHGTFYALMYNKKDIKKEDDAVSIRDAHTLNTIEQ